MTFDGAPRFWGNLSPQLVEILRPKIVGFETTLDETAGILDYLQNEVTPPIQLAVDEPWRFVNASPERNRGWIFERRLPFLWMKMSGSPWNDTKQFVTIPPGVSPDASRILLLYPDLYPQTDEMPEAVLVSALELTMLTDGDNGQKSLTLDVEQFQHATDFEQTGRRFAEEWGWLKMPDLALHFVEQLGVYLRENVSGGEKLGHITLMPNMWYQGVARLRLDHKYDVAADESLYGMGRRFCKPLSEVIPDVRLQGSIANSLKEYENG